MTRLIPAQRHQIEIQVSNSRFIASAAPVFTVDEAKAFIDEIKTQYADATHNVPAFIIGHGSSVTEHCSDDGEPSGTAGRPALSVLKGSGFGDIAVVITRYFGGTKLGTGGLVRAYSDAMRTVLDEIPRAQKVATQTLMFALHYNQFEQAKLLVEAHNGVLDETDWGVDVVIVATFRTVDVPAFQAALKEFTHGDVEGEMMHSDDHTIMPLDG